MSATTYENNTYMTVENKPENECEYESHISSSNKAVVKIHGTKNTQCRCFICGSKSGRKAIPWAAIQQVWLEKQCYVDKSNRTCSVHLTEFNKFSKDKHTIEGTYVPKIMRFNRIACGILNKYFPLLFNNKDFHEVIADAVENHHTNSNDLKLEIENLGIHRMTKKWKKANENTIRDIPQLSMDDLKRLTLGSHKNTYRNT